MFSSRRFKRDIVTLPEFILDRQKDFPYAKGDLTTLLNDIGVAAKIVSREVRKAGLVNILGEMGTENVQGERQKKLDVFADQQFIAALRQGGVACGVASEEQDEFIAFDDQLYVGHPYVVAIDPLDGSSNIDVNVSIGTIFSIYRITESNRSAQLEDFLQPGRDLVAAGYVIYGSSTMLVFTTGRGVNGFTLDPSIGEFCLSHENIRIPDTGPYYSINEGNLRDCGQGVQEFIGWCKGEGGGVALSGRYIGSLVADFHRNLIKGGIYLYPTTTKAPLGKLRLLYECNPLAFIVEQAGGMASDGHRPIMDYQPRELHQRVPLFIGSPRLVQKAMDCILAEADSALKA
ncbi:MAG: class 1 fructose-bisphosphatase [Bacteroidia bacterium]|jgi:fructose-1,6-bisphosphatase I